MHGPEWYEKRDLDAFLAKLGPEICYLVKPTTGGYGESGHPDRCACINGAFWGFELKRPGKDPTPIQQKRIDAIWKAGGKAVGGTAEICIEFLERWLAARGIVVR